MRRWLLALVLAALFSSGALAQSNPLWHSQKVKNYLPHMTWPEVEARSSPTPFLPLAT
jgi:hypothetical protein